MTSLFHGHGISCIHIRGWDVNKWCARCRARLDQSISEGLSPRDIEQQADLGLIHAALVAVENGEIPVSPLLADFDLALTFTERTMPSRQ